VRLCPLSLGPDLCYSGSLLFTAGSLDLHTCSNTPILVVLSAHVPTSRRVKASGPENSLHFGGRREQEIFRGKKETDQRREREKRNPTAHSNTLESIVRT